MIVDIKEYGQIIKTDAGVIRVWISRAGGDPMRAGLPGVLEAKKKGNGWIFIIDAKRAEKYSGKSLSVSET